MCLNKGQDFFEIMYIYLQIRLASNSAANPQEKRKSFFLISRTDNFLNVDQQILEIRKKSKSYVDLKFWFWKKMKIFENFENKICKNMYMV